MCFIYKLLLFAVHLYSFSTGLHDGVGTDTNMNKTYLHCINRSTQKCWFQHVKAPIYSGLTQYHLDISHQYGMLQPLHILHGWLAGYIKQCSLQMFNVRYLNTTGQVDKGKHSNIITHYLVDKIH